MARIILILFLLVASQPSFCQLIDLNIQSSLDTVKISEELQIEIAIKNISDKPVYIPSDFFVISNILPNGLENNVRGFLLSFDIDPMSSWSSIHIENTALSNFNQFIKLKPGKTKNFQYDLNRHIKYFNDRLSTDSLNVPLNTQLTISSQFSNWRIKPKQKHRTATQKVVSNDIKVVLVE